jgi:hypothetical protein
MVRVSAFVVDGVPNSGTYFRYEFFSETQLPLLSILGNSAGIKRAEV